MITPCSCPHEGQDKIHGRGRRVYNQTTKGHRCSVCSKENSDSASKKGGKK